MARFLVAEGHKNTAIFRLNEFLPAYIGNYCAPSYMNKPMSS